MATFRLLDDLNAPVLDVEGRRSSGLARYLPDSVVQLRAVRPVAGALRKRLSEAPTDPVALEFAMAESLPLGESGDLAFDAGVRAGFGVHHADELLFPADDLRDAVSVPGGTAYVSLMLAPRVRVGLQGARGPLAFGFAAGTTVAVRHFQPFDLAGTDPSLASAIGETLTHAVVPADLDDLAALPVGAHVSLAGEAEVRFSAGVELASVTNPLATPGLPIVGSARISAGASAGLDAEIRASGGFEIRAAMVAPGRVRLSYYRRAGSEITIDAAAAVGVSAHIGDSDAIKRLIGAISSDPEADLIELVNAGLSDAQIEALQQAVKRSVDRSLRLSTEMQFSSARRGEALFAYDIDLQALAAEGRQAVEAALGGDLTAIGAAGASGSGPIRAVQTGLLAQRTRRIAWRINLFGIVNVHSVSELLRRGTLSYDPTTGTLNAADEIASERILVRTRPFESDGEKVRKLVFESTILTAAYHASRVTVGVALRCSAGYFEGRRRTSAADLRQDYNAIIGLGLADAAERDRRIGAEHDFGPSTFFLDCTFDQAAADDLFIGPDGPFTREYYERIGRDALLALIPPDDRERAHRRAAVEEEASWRALTEAGPAAARSQLVRRLGEVRAEHIIGDYVTIRWWADAMGGAARALTAMRQFLAGRSAASLMDDPQFQERRAALERELAEAVRESRARFGDPWGLLALDAAARRAAAAQAVIVSPRLTASYSARIPAARAIPPAAARAGMAGRAPRPFSADERELLRAHAINLRLGAFSDGGDFHTTETDVRRIFTELLPAEIAARKAAGEKLRLLFWAHGGLTSERGGLEPVLTRLKFWRRNGVYPLSFVWETGLRETIADMLGGLVGAREMAVRGVGEDLADAFLEFAARQPGKRIWGQMKRSAELASLETGGGLTVARLTLELWNAHHRDMEIHAAGHSAGTIFHAHFLPVLLGQAAGPGAPALAVKTLHFLAPACTNELFNRTLRGSIGPGKPIGAMTMYTMSESLELEDTAGPYRKSLLYLVSRAFETEQPAPILGLEESLRGDVRLVRFFGLAGHQKGADLLFSRTPLSAGPRSRTLATTHGSFDNDAATMNSVVRRVLDVPDTAAIVDFFEEALPEGPPQPAAVGEIVGSAVERVSGTPAGAPPVSIAPPVVPPPVSPAPAIVSTPRGARRALCVGIDQYGPPYDLAGCVNDARNWAAALGRLQFEVTAIHDQSASRSAILDALATLVGTAAPGDVIVFQFAGHGTQVDDLDGEEGDALDESFCPADFSSGRLLIDDDVRAVIAGLKDGVNMTCFIDCCHSGTITRALTPGARPSHVPPGSRARYIRYSRQLSNLHRDFRAGLGAAGLASGAGRDVAAAEMKEVCFSACQPSEVAYETAGAGQFTTRALAVLAAGAALTNAAFAEQVVAAFGSRPPQHPHLDCADEARPRLLLQPLGAPAPIG